MTVTGADPTTVEFTLNGETVVVRPDSETSMLELLRDELGCTSVKDGCSPEGSCGACTILVDGHAQVCCAQKVAHFAGKHIVTQEGLGSETRQLWAQCFSAAGASQCGYCSPGIVMKAEGLLAKHSEPTRAEIAHALLGNLCRCTGYAKVIDAIELAAAARRGEPVPAPDRSGRVGSRSARYQGSELALGDRPFVGDMVVEGMAHGALRFSEHPRARVLRIDTSKAETYPGVIAVVTAADVPGERTQGSITRDWRQLVAVGEITAYVGDVIAAVAAETRPAARAAAALVEVAYEVLDPITDPFDALEEGAPMLHAGGNVLSVSRVKRGDATAALAGAAHVVSQRFRTQRIEHAFLEPESSLAVPDDGGVRVFSQGQGVWDDRRQIASCLGLPQEAVRVTQVATGGAFGAKEDVGLQCHSALLATTADRPVRITLTRAESLRFHSKRHPMWLDYCVGCDEEGRLLAVRAHIVGDTGAYASVGDKVLERAAGHACGPYRVPNVDVEALAVYTNNPPAGAMRGFGVNQASFAIEGALDMLAGQVGIDGWEMRWRNALDVGDRFATGQLLGEGVGLKQTLLAVRDAYRDARYAGIACVAKNTGIGNGMTEYGKAILRPETDGTVTLYHSWTEMGQGVNTVLAQIACTELELEPDRVRVVVDTERDLEAGQTTASRATVLGGNAVIDAARKLEAARTGRSLAELAGMEFEGEFVCDWTTGLDAAEPVTHLAFSWGTQVALLDQEGRLTRIVAAHDVGRALNPMLAEGQIEGGVHMGLGQALSEEFVVENGVPVTTTLKSLHIVPPTGMPEVECILVEVPQPEGPYGAKGIGEAALVPTAAAVAAALYAFDGVRRTSLPMKDSPAALAAVPHLADHPHSRAPS
ncbi:MAG TPA: selenium-dependent xanthine dehydrogenase [Gaiellaceae bacterium]|nr:selenium-dependent xanthine dehydrogenase [Gaiellaceae bacterium]